MIIHLWGEEGVDYEYLYLRSRFGSLVRSQLSKTIRSVSEVSHVRIQSQYSKLVSPLGIDGVYDDFVPSLEPVVYLNLGALQLDARTISRGIQLHREEGMPICSITGENPYRWHQYRNGTLKFQKDILPGECPAHLSPPGGVPVRFNSASWVVAALDRNGDIVDFCQAPLSREPVSLSLDGKAGTGNESILSFPFDSSIVKFQVLLVEWGCSSEESCFQLPARFPGLWRYDFQKRKWITEAGVEITGRHDVPNFDSISNAFMICSIRDHQNRSNWLQAGEVLPFRITAKKATVIRNEVDVLRSLPGLQSVRVGTKGTA